MNHADTKEVARMPSRTVRARFFGGSLRPLEALELPDGAEVNVTVDYPEADARQAPRPRLAVWNLGAPPTLTRGDYYEPGE